MPDPDRSSNPDDFQFKFKIWLAGPDGFTFGPGDLKLLVSLRSTQNLTETSKRVGYSYKYAWQKLQQMTKKTGREVVTTHRGGKGGGGDVKITNWGLYLIQKFEQAQLELNQLAEEMNNTLTLQPFENAME
jgi:molybdate transport repressor ModE-like protein